MDSSTARRASPLCLDLTFPSGATQEKGKKKKKRTAQRLLGVFVMSPSRQRVCMHISDPGRDRHKDKYIQHAHRCTHTHTLTHTHTHTPALRKRISSQDH